MDANGVTNYSNTPPPKSANAKTIVVPEDRLSVYTPDESVTHALEAARARGRAPAQGAIPSPAMLEPDRRVLLPPPSPGVDPCATPGDPRCATYLYDGSPVFQNRRRPPPLAQPQLPPGTIAGTATAAGGAIPGQSGATATAPPNRPLTRSAPLRDIEFERESARR